MPAGVYEIRNRRSGKSYIGSSFDIDTRIRHHRTMLNAGKHGNPHLQASWAKGPEDFEFRHLIHSTKEMAVFFEQRAIDGLKPAFNIAPIAGSCLGFRHTPETRAKISAAKMGNTATLGRKHTPEAKAKQALSKIGNQHTKGTRRRPESIERTASAHRGMKRSDETRKRISAAMTGKKRAPYSATTLLKLSIVNQGKGRLTDEQVRSIRRLRANGTTRDKVAAEFGISPSLVSLIALRKRYWHVHDEPSV